MRAIALIVLLALAGVASAARAQDAADLRWRWRVGERLTYRVRSLQAMTITATPAGATPTAVTVDETWTLDVEPREVNADGAARLDITHRAVRYELRVGGALKEAHDSEKEAISLDTPLGRSESAMLGVTLSASVRASGQVEGLLMPHGSLLARARQLRVERPETAFSDGAIVSRLELLLHVLPATAVSPGEAWTARRRLDVWAGGAIERRCTYRLDRIAGEAGGALATIGIDTALEVKEEPAPPGHSTAARVTAETRDASGSAVFAAGRGALLRLEQRWTTKMTTRTATETVSVSVICNENHVELVE